MKSELRRLADAAWQIALDARASRIEKIEALKLIAAAKGVLLPDIDERWLTVRQVTQLRQAKQSLVEKALHRKAQRKRQNRRALLRQKIRTLETANGGSVEQS